MPNATSESHYVVCVRNSGCEDLEVLKIYRVLADKRAAREGYIRVVDESGDDYLYPESYFKLPLRALREVAAGV